jgi:hypothetical protein
MARIVIIGVVVGVVVVGLLCGLVMLARRRVHREAEFSAELEARRLARLETSRPAQFIPAPQAGVREFHIHLAGVTAGDAADASTGW